jgi:protein pelota
METMLQKYDLEKVEAMVVGSPGFVKDGFFKHLKNHMDMSAKSPLKNNIDKFIMVHVSSGFKHSVQEIMTNQAV